MDYQYNNNNYNGNYGQNGYSPYGNGYYYQPYQPPTPQRADNPFYKKEKRELRFLGNVFGGILLLVFAVQNLLVLPVLLNPTLKNLYSENVVFQSAVYIIISVLSTFLISFFANRIVAKKCTVDYGDVFKKPRSVKSMVLAVFSGLGMCIAANYFVGIISTVLSGFGITLSSETDQTLPETVFAAIIFLIANSVIPALIEEFAMRCTVLQPLRKYGEGFSIFITAFLFGMWHGNFTQMIFAFIIGLALAYYVTQTGSILTGILIHFANNLFASVMTMVTDSMDTSAKNIVYSSSFAVLAVLGIAATILFFVSKDRVKLPAPSCYLNGSEKRKTFFASPAMIVAIIVYFGQALLLLIQANTTSSVGLQ